MTEDPTPWRVGVGSLRLAGKDIEVAFDVSLVSFQALNNLQSTFSGFGYINSENVFKVPGLGEG